MRSYCLCGVPNNLKTPIVLAFKVKIQRRRCNQDVERGRSAARRAMRRVAAERLAGRDQNAKFFDSTAECLIARNEPKPEGNCARRLGERPPCDSVLEFCHCAAAKLGNTDGFSGLQVELENCCSGITPVRDQLHQFSSIGTRKLTFSFARLLQHVSYASTGCRPTTSPRVKRYTTCFDVLVATDLASSTARW